VTPIQLVHQDPKVFGCKTASHPVSSLYEVTPKQVPDITFVSDGLREGCQLFLVCLSQPSSAVAKVSN